MHPLLPSSTQLHPPPNLGRKMKDCPFWLKIGTHGILVVLSLNPDLDFWNSDHKIHFCANLGPKIQSCLFCLKIGAHSISRMQILNPDFWILTPKSIFWQIWVQKLKVVHFVSKLVHKISQECWFLFQHLFSELQILISFLGKFEPKKSKLSI